MTRRFSVRTTPRFERLLRSLRKPHHDIPDLLATAVRVLEADPYNVGRQQNIRKLEGIREGEGQYRLTLGR